MTLLIGDREKHPWGDALGLTSGTIQRLFKGQIPGPDVLSVIARAENVSLSWLLEARGAPYVITVTDGDVHAADLLRMLLDDEPGWSVVLATDGHDVAAVLHQPCEVDYKGATVPYRCIEVLTGPLGDECRALLAQAIAAGRGVSVADLESKRLRDLRDGLLGSYALFGDQHRPGLLSGARPLGVQGLDQVMLPGRLAEARALYRPDPLCDALGRLSPGARRVASATINGLLEMEEEHDAD